MRVDELGNLLGRSLMKLEIDLRIALGERLDHLWQYIARLRVRRRNRQRAGLLPLELTRKVRDVFYLAQHTPRAVDDFLTGRRDGRETLALAREQLHAQLALELLELLADPRLARIEPLGGCRDVEAAVDDRDQVLELLERHYSIESGSLPGRERKSRFLGRVGGVAPSHITIG
jgi:hypothetical protein